MNRMLKAFVVGLLFMPLNIVAKDVDPLVGLWAAYKRFGPEISGPLRINAALKRAEIGAYAVDVTRQDASIRFELPDERGSFIGYLDGDAITGHWIQPPPMQIGQNMASPVTLRQLSGGVWQGSVSPRPSEYTFYLPVSLGEDGELNTYLRNPDRNLGLFANLKRIERDGSDLSFVGSYGRSDEEQEITTGAFDAQNDVLSMQLPPWRGGVYEFNRVADETHSAFHARPTDADAWRYMPPSALDDGWETSTLSDVGIDASVIQKMIDDEIVTRDDSIHSHRVHGVLIARHGKLVLEEYFHGFNRDMPHDTRSASKSVVSMLVGAASEAGFEISANTPVFDTLDGLSEDRDPRKQAMTLGHLLTMSSGFYCDDNDSDAPGNENTLQEQSEQPDWYRYTLDLPMAQAPGKNAIYCSANSNLIGAVVSKTTNMSLARLVFDLIAKPLDIKQYYLGLQPTGEAYFGGGAQWLPRDFMKIGQVMLNGGTWNGRRILSESWVAESTAEQVKIGDRPYGYQWWRAEYPYGDGTVQAFFAAGNGGQIVMGVPELDLTIAFYGGNYSDAVSYRAQNVLIPEYILKATAVLREAVEAD